VSETHTIDGKPLDLQYTEMQKAIFLDSTSKYVVASCGRRSGKTYGAAQWSVDIMGGGEPHRILWVDVVYHQCISYFEKYFHPLLSRIEPSVWSWIKSERELKLCNSSLTMRSADRPDKLVGQGYDICILNEGGIILNEKPSIWNQILRPMLLDYHNSRAFFIGTPRGKIGDDGEEALYWTLFKRGQDRTAHPDYSSFQMPTSANPWISRQDIAELEADIPYFLRQQELGGEFIDALTDSIVPATMWKFIDEPVADAQRLERIISVDAACKDGEENDYSVATTWDLTANGFHLIDCWRDRVQFPGLVEGVKACYERWHPSRIIIEDTSSGSPLIQMFKAETRLPIMPISTGGRDKVSRLQAVANLFATGRVSILRGQPWTQRVINELAAFPKGHDDITDSTSMALLHLHAGQWDSKRIPISRSITASPKVDTRGLRALEGGELIGAGRMRSRDVLQGFDLE
jgi:predicted phage terminase large subunit-like protein